MTTPLRFPESRVRVVQPRLVDLRRRLHAIPELGLELPETAALVEAELRALGLEPRRVGDGLWADLGRRGPLVAIRADMDGLPVTEATGLPFASRHPGRMHACGHDAHTACLLGGAALLAQEAAGDRLPYRVRLVFQSGEEGHAGALPLIEAGVLDGVAAMVGCHVGSFAGELAPGQAGFLPGPIMAASDRFLGAFSGRGGHGSEPHRCADPVSALAELVLGLATFRARELDQARPSVVSVCSVHAGETFNVIPTRAEFMGTARSIHPDIREAMAGRIGEIAGGIAGQHGLELEYQWIYGYPPLVNEPRATATAAAAAAAVLGPDRVVALTRPSMAGEDFAYYLERVPGCYWFLNTMAPERAIEHPNHSCRFDLDEDLLWVVTAVNLAAAESLALDCR